MGSAGTGSTFTSGRTIGGGAGAGTDRAPIQNTPRLKTATIATNSKTTSNTATTMMMAPVVLDSRESSSFMPGDSPANRARKATAYQNSAARNVTTAITTAAATAPATTR